MEVEHQPYTRIVIVRFRTLAALYDWINLAEAELSKARLYRIMRTTRRPSVRILLNDEYEAKDFARGAAIVAYSRDATGARLRGESR